MFSDFLNYLRNRRYLKQVPPNFPWFLWEPGDSSQRTWILCATGLRHYRPIGWARHLQKEESYRKWKLNLWREIPLREVKCGQLSKKDWLFGSEWGLMSSQAHPGTSHRHPQNTWGLCKKEGCGIENLSLEAPQLRGKKASWKIQSGKAESTSLVSGGEEKRWCWWVRRSEELCEQDPWAVWRSVVSGAVWAWSAG